MRGVLFIHGFSAVEEDNRYLIEYLKKKHIPVYTFILPGHETKHIGKVPYEKWLDASRKELENVLKKHKKVDIIGHSMGAAIAAILASEYKQVHKLVLISPAFEVGSFSQNREDFRNLFKKRGENIETGFEGMFKKAFRVPFSDLKEVKKLGELASSKLESVTCPVLLLHGTLDQIVPFSSSIHAMEKIKSKKHLTVITDVRHQVLKSHKKEQVARYIYKYLQGGLHFRLAVTEHL